MIHTFIYFASENEHEREHSEPKTIFCPCEKVTNGLKKSIALDYFADTNDTGPFWFWVKPVEGGKVEKFRAGVMPPVAYLM